MRFVFQISNPFFQKGRESKDYFYKHWTLSTNKSAEIQISKFDRDRLIDCTIDLHWWGEDHAGPKIDFSFLGYMFTASIYDHRHWDYDNHRWERYDDELELGDVEESDDELFDRALFESGCNQHTMNNGPVNGYIVDDDKLRKFADIYRGR